MKIKYIKTLSLIVLFALNGCFLTRKENVKQPVTPDIIMSKAYSEVVLEDGISKKEASVLATAYFTAYISLCGATSPDPEDLGDRWEVKTKFGYAAEPFESIFINKTNGTITCKKGPTINK